MRRRWKGGDEGMKWVFRVAAGEPPNAARRKRLVDLQIRDK
jgi:hypothetical protein